MAPEPTTYTDLDEFIPRPDAGTAKRHMLAINTEDYAKITELSVLHETTRGRIITALLAYYNNVDDD